MPMVRECFFYTQHMRNPDLFYKIHYVLRLMIPPTRVLLLMMHSSGGTFLNREQSLNFVSPPNCCVIPGFTIPIWSSAEYDSVRKSLRNL